MLVQQRCVMLFKRSTVTRFELRLLICGAIMRRGRLIYFLAHTPSSSIGCLGDGCCYGMRLLMPTLIGSSLG